MQVRMPLWDIDLHAWQHSTRQDHLTTTSVSLHAPHSAPVHWLLMAIPQSFLPLPGRNTGTRTPLYAWKCSDVVDSDWHRLLTAPMPPRRV